MPVCWSGGGGSRADGVVVGREGGLGKLIGRGRGVLEIDQHTDPTCQIEPSVSPFMILCPPLLPSHVLPIFITPWFYPKETLHLFSLLCRRHPDLRPLTKSDSSVRPLLDCLDDIKAWMSLNFLNFNEQTEVMVFSGTSMTPLVELASLAQYHKTIVNNLGVKLDTELKFDSQITVVVKSRFFQLRQLKKIKPIIEGRLFQTVIHVFVTSRLDYCNALYFGASTSSIARLQLVQNAAARILTGTRRFDLLFAFKSLNGLASLYFTELLHPYMPSRSLRSANQLLLSVPPTRLKLRGGQAFPVAAPKLWNNFPLHLRQASSLSHFKSLLKTHLF